MGSKYPSIPVVELPRTVQWHSEKVGESTRRLESDGISTCMDDVGEDKAWLLILHLKGGLGLKEPTSPNTINYRVRSRGPFLHWLHRQGCN